jgi:pimeloyl-ACP methyl ester carboxylesterase
MIAEESGHDIQNEQPDLVVQAIRRVVASANSSR